ncbi:MAG: DUF3991 and toprim domain-containing protein [Peptococcaceae bacterium]|nr:DUF3991 and toprim domain-containing protein [Peptococcaceae bacterium]
MLFSRDTIIKARRADLVQYLRLKGYDLKKEGKNWRVPGYGGLVVRDNSFYHFSTNLGGNSLDFCLQILKIPFCQAVLELIEVPAIAVDRIVSGSGKKLMKELEMPARFRNEHRVIAYLTKTRMLPAGLVVDLIRMGLLYQDEKGNCVFVCKDEAGLARGAILAGTVSSVNWKGLAAGSDTSYGWWWPPLETEVAECLAVVESPVDAISLAVINPDIRFSHILALGGLHKEALEGFLERINVRNIVLALDDDLWGRKAAWCWSEWLLRHGYNVVYISPGGQAKDWNELLSRMASY